MTRKQCVYVVALAGAEIVKIGIAADPAKRLRQLQGANHGHLSLAFTSRPTLPSIAAQVEYRVHSVLSGDRIRGEWFSCGSGKAIAAIVAAFPYVKNARHNRTPVADRRANFGTGRK